MTALLLAVAAATWLAPHLSPAWRAAAIAVALLAAGCRSVWMVAHALDDLDGDDGEWVGWDEYPRDEGAGTSVAGGPRRPGRWWGL